LELIMNKELEKPIELTPEMEIYTIGGFDYDPPSDREPSKPPVTGYRDGVMRQVAPGQEAETLTRLCLERKFKEAEEKLKTDATNVLLHGIDMIEVMRHTSKELGKTLVEVNRVGRKHK
jgi:hypothetical protein